MFTFTWDERVKGDDWVSPHTYGDSLSSTSLATYVGLGVFEGCVQNSQLRSINTSSNPSVSMTLNQFYNSAVYNRNWQYNQQLPMTYAWYIIQLYFVKGDRNTQTAYGYGITNTYPMQVINKDWSPTNAWNNGVTTNRTTGVTALGIQNAWGNSYKHMGEMSDDNGTIRFSILGGKDHNNWSTWKTVVTGLYSTYGGTISKIVGTKEYPFFQKEYVSYNNDYYYADSVYRSSYSSMIVLTGGYFSSNLNAGALYLYIVADYANSYYGARLHVLII